MKRLFSALLCAIILLTPLFQTVSFAQSVSELSSEYGYPIDPAYLPKGGTIVADATTGAILWQEDEQILWPTASLAKMMVVYLAYQAMARGDFTEQTEVEVSEDVAYLSSDSELSNNYMPLGSVFTISELLDLTIIPSSASAVLLLANQLGTHQEVVWLMNQTARDMGMANTTYVNVVGATNDLLLPYLEGLTPGADNISTAYDQAIFAAHLVRDYPQVLAHSVQPSFVLKPGTEFEELFESRNLTLPGAYYAFEGMDGLKTGSTNEAAYNLALTAQQGDTRLVAIVQGAGLWEDWESEGYRSIIGHVLMSESFSKYASRVVLPAGEHVIDGRRIITTEDLIDTVGDEPLSFTLLDERVVRVSDRAYLPGFEAPSVAFEDVTVPVEVDQDIPEAEPVDEPTDPVMQKNIKQSLITLTLYLIGLLLLLLILRASILRAVRRRIQRDKRRWRG